MGSANHIQHLGEYRFPKERFESACAGKQPFPTLEAAEQYLAILHSKKIRHGRFHNLRDPLQLDAYPCDFCGEFHIGH